MKTTEDELFLKALQHRQTEDKFNSGLVALLAGRSAELRCLVVNRYVRALSTRDIEELFRFDDGEITLSKSTVCIITVYTWEDYEAFCKCGLSGFDMEYLFLNAVYESLRKQGCMNELYAHGLTWMMGAK